jgi:hypothetical protein
MLGPVLVGERQAAAPGFGHDLAAQRFQERRCVRVGDGHDGNLGDGLTLSSGISFAPGLRRRRGLRIAGIDGHIHHAAALHAVGGRMGPSG